MPARSWSHGTDHAAQYPRSGRKPYQCPHCGSTDVRYQAVKGDYGTYDTKNMYCRKCWKEFPTPKKSAQHRVEPTIESGDTPPANTNQSESDSPA